MTDNIRNIFEQNIRLLKGLNQAVFCFRKQQYDRALSFLANRIELIKYVIEAIITDREYFNLVSTDTVMEMLSGILNAQKTRDYILLSDLLELQLVSFLCGVQELIISKEEIVFDEEKYLENIELLQERGDGFSGISLESINPALLLEKGYRVEFTSCGLMTLAAENNDSQFYFHTNSQVYTEAGILAEHWYQKEAKRFIIYGLGMGYHIAELKELALEQNIEVYEADLNVIKLACAFSNIREILNCDHVRIIYDPDYKALKQRIDSLVSTDSVHIHYPSFQNIRSIEGRELLERFIPWSKSIESC